MAHLKEAPGRLELVRAFVNTLEPATGTDELSSARALGQWLHDHGLAPEGARPSRDDLEGAVELREAIRLGLEANTEGVSAPALACETINRVSKRACLMPRLLPDGQTVLEPQARGIDGALGRLLAVLHGAVADGTWLRLKACREHSCRRAFYDHTRNRAGAWCTMAVCGNRAKARSYRERRSHNAAS